MNHIHSTEYGIAPEDSELVLNSLQVACEQLGQRAVAKAVRMSLFGCLVSGLEPLERLSSRGRGDSLTYSPRLCGRASYHKLGGQKVSILRLLLAEPRD